jgi:hypothetical protein
VVLSRFFPGCQHQNRIDLSHQMAQVLTEAVNTTVTAGHAQVDREHLGLIAQVFQGSSVISVLLTLVLAAVVYDQCEWQLDMISADWQACTSIVKAA